MTSTGSFQKAALFARKIASAKIRPPYPSLPSDLFENIDNDGKDVTEYEEPEQPEWNFDHVV
jgi:hypothetical protein